MKKSVRAEERAGDPLSAIEVSIFKVVGIMLLGGVLLAWFVFPKAFWPGMSTVALPKARTVLSQKLHSLAMEIPETWSMRQAAEGRTGFFVQLDCTPLGIEYLTNMLARANDAEYANRRWRIHREDVASALVSDCIPEWWPTSFRGSTAIMADSVAIGAGERRPDRDIQFFLAGNGNLFVWICGR